MNWFRVRLKLRSWVASSWQSDTIFGHLCWGMRYLRGVQELESFIAAYDDGVPPLLLSNGFPGDLLPRPLTGPAMVDPALPLQEQVAQFRHMKRAREVRYLTSEEFTQALNGEIIVPSSEPVAVGKSRVTLKNQLNRQTSTTGEGGALYNFEEYHWPEVTIYGKVTDGFADMAQQMFQYMADTGYGKRKSVGYGQIEDCVFEEYPGFNTAENSNGFVTLSNYVPAAVDPREGFWRTMVKYGKMGEEYAVQDSAFKKPLMMLEAGSTFFDAPCRDYYGRLVRGLNPSYPETVQYALALPVPMRLPDDQSASRNSGHRNEGNSQ